LSQPPIVQIQDLRFAYGKSDFALSVEALSIPVGERVACVGASGSGKTTLLNLMAGILAPERGRVQVGPDELGSLTEAQRRAVRIEHIGMVFQEFELLESLTSEENIWLPYLVAPSLELNNQVKARARSLAESTGVTHVLKRRPARLSQGERQRIALCRALITDPNLVLADEPTGNLDPDSASAALDLVFEQCAARGATLVMVTHDHTLLGRFDRVIDMRQLVTRTTGGAV
jgi:putative ABC transport system ATP-binding protein